MRQLWRVAPELLEQAQDDATLIAIRDQERAGIDIVSDGEMRRESYFNRFATALDGIDLDHPGTVISRTGKPALVPRVVGRVRRLRPVNVRDVQFLRANTERQIKITVPGPFTMTKLAQNDYYASDADLAMDYAAAVNAEIRDLFTAGADVVQVDEPYMQVHPTDARSYGVAALQRALDGITGTTVVHICFGYGAMVKGKPARYDFLSELAATTRAAGLRRNGAVRAGLFRACRPRRQDRSARGSRSVDERRRVARSGCRSDSPRAAVRPGRAADCGAGLRHEVPDARGRLRETGRHGPGRRIGARRAAVECRRERVNAALDITVWRIP